MSVLARIAAAVAVAAPLALTAPAADAAVVPTHAIIVCQSASFYANYDSASGPTGLLRVLPYGDKVGHTPESTPCTTAGRRPSILVPTIGAMYVRSA